MRATRVLGRASRVERDTMATPRERLLELIKRAGFQHRDGKHKGEADLTAFAAYVERSLANVNAYTKPDRGDKWVSAKFVAHIGPYLRDKGIPASEIVKLTAPTPDQVESKLEATGPPATTTTTAPATAVTESVEPLPVAHQVTGGWWSRADVGRVTGSTRGYLAAVMTGVPASEQFEVVVNDADYEPEFPFGSHLHCVHLSSNIGRSSAFKDKWRLCMTRHPQAEDLWRITLRRPDDVSKHDECFGVIVGVYRVL